MSIDGSILKLDFDCTPNQRVSIISHICRRISLLQINGTYVFSIPSVRQTRRGIHVRIFCHRTDGLIGPRINGPTTIGLCDAEVIALQAALGSDPYRECANLCRISRGIGVTDGNILFEGKTRVKGDWVKLRSGETLYLHWAEKRIARAMNNTRRKNIEMKLSIHGVDDPHTGDVDTV